MFVGKFNNSIDSKSRMIVPAKFRDELKGRCIIAKSLDKCLTIYPEEQWEKFVKEKLSVLPMGNEGARKLRRHFYSSAAECDVDKQGRLTIPQELKDRFADRDPLAVARRQVQEQGWLTEDEIATIQTECADEVQRAVAQAQKEPTPNPATEDWSATSWKPTRY